MTSYKSNVPFKWGLSKLTVDNIDYSDVYVLGKCGMFRVKLWFSLLWEVYIWFPSQGLNFQLYVDYSVMITAYDSTCLDVHRIVLQVSKLIS